METDKCWFGRKLKSLKWGDGSEFEAADIPWAIKPGMTLCHVRPS